MAVRVYKAIRNCVRPAPEGRHILLLSQYSWGKGETLEEAFKQLKKVSGGELNSKTHVVAYHVPPKAYVDCTGNICWNRDEGDVVRVARINQRVKWTTSLISEVEDSVLGKNV